MVSTAMAVAGGMKYGRNAMATSALPNPASPRTMLPAAMTGVHVDLEENGRGAAVQGAHPGHPLGGLPVHHLAVIEGCPDEDRRIGSSRQVGVRAVRLDVVVLLPDLGIAPF